MIAVEKDPALARQLQRRFAPVLGVEVVLLRLARRDERRLAPRQARLFRDFAVYAFTAWQPTLRATLERLWPHCRPRRLIAELGITSQATPAAVRFDQWLALFAAFTSHAAPRARALIRGAERRWRRQQAGLQKIQRTRVALVWRTRG